MAHEHRPRASQPGSREDRVSRDRRADLSLGSGGNEASEWGGSKLSCHKTSRGTGGTPGGHDNLRVKRRENKI